MQSNPWSDVENRYQPGQPVTGKVTRLTHFGLFVEVEPGLEGVVYTFELGQGPAALTAFVPDQQVQFYVKSIDIAHKRLELSPQSGDVLPPLSSPFPIPEPLPESARQALTATFPQTQIEPDLLLPSPVKSSFKPDKLSATLRHSLAEQFQQPEAKSAPESSRPCPTCQQATQSAWRFCVYCGGSLQRTCPACSSIQPDLPDAHYCWACGKNVP